MPRQRNFEQENLFKEDTAPVTPTTAPEAPATFKPVYTGDAAEVVALARLRGYTEADFINALIEHAGMSISTKGQDIICDKFKRKYNSDNT